jgi:asparagine synthase (glutamine-hydrolysing)
MCGISGIVNFNGSNGAALKLANSVIRHRGPDDEGYLTWASGNEVQLWAGSDTAPGSKDALNLSVLPDDQLFKVGFGHRRLSIIDLSPAGHQPMVLQEAGLAICFNGEVYNYLEVKAELEAMGVHFHTKSDTEVILQAWHHWGDRALQKFNGMFAFLMLDSQRQLLYAVRDRFGVKPLYYTHTSGYLAFGSEVKQLRKLPAYQFKLNEKIAYQYLCYSHIDHDSETFEEGVMQVRPGHFLKVDLKENVVEETEWYQLQPRIWSGTELEATEAFAAVLKDAVKLRMRSDVPVGSALSGGLDSSTIVCLMRQVLDDESHQKKQLETVTSSSLDKRYDETHYAELVNQQTNSHSHKTYPSFEKLQDDFDRLLWHMDYPFGSTSQFSQWCVFEAAGKAGLTVMIDGQGADEQLAGYGGNDLALYSGLIRKGKWTDLWQEVQGYKKRNGFLPKGFLIGGLIAQLPEAAGKAVPGRWNPWRQDHAEWLLPRNIDATTMPQDSLQRYLMSQVYVAPLPSLLRYEDRNSMAFSVESRTPFMDYRVLEFTMGLPERLVYRNNERKYILRQAFKGKVPQAVLDRQDKMGFVSAEERWMKEDGKEWFTHQMADSCKLLQDFVDPNLAMVYFHKMQQGNIPFTFDPWRVICLGQWLKSF